MPEIEEAQEILEALGMPKAQYNIRSLDTEEQMAAIVRGMDQKRLWYADLIARGARIVDIVFYKLLYLYYL